MSRETIAQKSARYLAEARLNVERVVGDEVSAHCRGNGAEYELGHDLRRGWFCSCPARTDRCAHLEALRRVVVRRSA